MISDYAVFGVLIHPYMLALIFAILVSRPVCLLINRAGFYRFVWHPGLFDMAVFFLLYGIFVWMFVPGLLPSPLRFSVWQKGKTENWI